MTQLMHRQDATASESLVQAPRARLLVGQAFLRLMVAVLAVLLGLVFVAAWRPDVIDRALLALGY